MKPRYFIIQAEKLSKLIGKNVKTIFSKKKDNQPKPNRTNQPIFRVPKWSILKNIPKKSSKIKPQIRKSRRVLYFLAWLLFWPLLKILFTFRSKKTKEFKKHKGAMLVIAPHQNYLDPVFLAHVLGPWNPPRIVAGSVLADSDLVRKFFQRAEIITVTQFRADSRAMLQIARSLKSGDIVALFPEGERSLDGRHDHFSDALLKCLQKGWADLAMIDLHGAYFSWPRWKKGLFSPGKIEAEASILANKEELSKMSSDQIRELMRKALSSNDFEWQAKKENPSRYLTFLNAEQLDDLLYICPNCAAIGTLFAKGSYLRCEYCQAESKLKMTGFLEPSKRKNIKSSDFENKKKMTLKNTGKNQGLNNLKAIYPLAFSQKFTKHTIEPLGFQSNIQLQREWQIQAARKCYQDGIYFNVEALLRHEGKGIWQPLIASERKDPKKVKNIGRDEKGSDCLLIYHQKKLLVFPYLFFKNSIKQDLNTTIKELSEKVQPYEELQGLLNLAPETAVYNHPDRPYIQFWGGDTLYRFFFKQPREVTVLMDLIDKKEFA